MRFMSSIQGLVSSLGNPKQLKASVETLGFNHMNLEVTLPRVVIFRDSIVELLEIELGDDFTEQAREGFVALLNYVGGAIIFIKTHYSERLKVLGDSWRKATDPEYGSLRKPSVTSELTKAQGTDDVPDDQQSNGAARVRGRGLTEHPEQQTFQVVAPGSPPRHGALGPLGWQPRQRRWGLELRRGQPEEQPEDDRQDVEQRPGGQNGGEDLPGDVRLQRSSHGLLLQRLAQGGR